MENYQYTTEQFVKDLDKYTDALAARSTADALTEENKWFTFTPSIAPGVPHVDTFIARWASVSKIYVNPDEAYQQSRTDASNMRRDPDIMEPLQQRLYATALLDWQVTPEDQHNPEQKDYCDQLTQIVERTPYFRDMLHVLLQAAWFGKYGVNVLYHWDDRRPSWMACRKWIPVHGDKIRYAWDTNQAGIMSGKVPEDKERRFSDEGQTAMLSERDRLGYIIHRHEVEDGDFFEGRSAGSIYGVGLRTRVYWTWYLKQELTRWLMNWAQRAGTGFTIFYYESGNDKQREEVRTAAEQNQNENVIIMPRSSEGKQQGAGIERVEVSANGVQFFKEVLEGYFGDKIRRMIIGQTMTSKTGQTGLGSNVAEIHQDTFDMIVKFDALRLAETLTREFLWVIQDWTFPGCTWRPKFEFVLESREPADVLEAAEKFVNLGGQVIEDEVREVCGFRRPEKGDKLLQPQKQEPSMAGMGGMGAPGFGVPQNGNGHAPMNGQNGNGAMQFKRRRRGRSRR